MKKILFVAVIVLAACRKHETPAGTAEAPKPAPQQSTTASPEKPAGMINVGNELPAYKAQWLDGSEFDLASQKGSVVLLNLWATWCGPCRYEIPELEKMHKKNAARGFKVIGVSVDEEGAKVVKPFVDDQKITYPIVLDPEGKLAAILQTTNLPTSVLLDKSGKVVWRSVGIVDPADPLMNRALEAALK
jgi:thiol-disulfide isomerase/thioredoxin